MFSGNVFQGELKFLKILDLLYIPKTNQHHPINENHTDAIHNTTTDNNAEGVDAASTSKEHKETTEVDLSITNTSIEHPNSKFYRLRPAFSSIKEFLYIQCIVPKTISLHLTYCTVQSFAETTLRK